jgi:hypothetical protein
MTEREIIVKKLFKETSASYGKCDGLKNVFTGDESTAFFKKIPK